MRILFALVLALAGFGAAAQPAPSPFSAPGQTSQAKSISTAVNLAGRQRMLSQRAAKAYLMIGMKVAPERGAAILRESVAQFDRQLADLNTFAPSQAVRDGLVQMAAKWATLKTLLDAAPSRAGAASVYDANEAVQAAAHRVTLAYEALSRDPQDHSINLLGRQRMLSQRIAKFHLFIGWDVQRAAAQLEFNMTRAEFASGLYQLSLAAGDAPELKPELQRLAEDYESLQLAVAPAADPEEAARRSIRVVMLSESMLGRLEQIMDRYDPPPR